MRYRVLLVDPVRHRREKAAELLQGHYDIAVVGSQAEALQAIAARKPDAVVLTLRQLDVNGLVVGKALRAMLGGDPLVLVHGDSTPPASSAERAIAAANHEVNGWLAGTLEPTAIDTLVGSALARRYQPKVDRERKTAWATLKDDRGAIWEFLTRHRNLIPTPPRAADEPPGWIEILNAPPAAAMRLLAVKVRA